MLISYRGNEVFGKKLEKKLKEQKDSFKDLIPEWNDRGQKIKITGPNESNFKRQT